MNKFKVFTISDQQYKVYVPGHGAIAAMNYAMKQAFIDVHKRAPGIKNVEESIKEHTVWDIEPSVELETWKLENQDHPRVDFRIAEAILHPLDPLHPFSEDVYMSADPMEVAEALSFFILNLPGNGQSQASSTPAFKPSGTSRRKTK